MTELAPVREVRWDDLDPTTPVPPRGWVPAGELFWCDACTQRRWYWELHHLDPIGWGGPDSRALADRQVVWVRVCGDCHSTAHMILDVFKARGAWDDAWLAACGFPHYYVEVARRGWQLSQKRLAAA